VSRESNRIIFSGAELQATYSFPPEHVTDGYSPDEMAWLQQLTGASVKTVPQPPLLQLPLLPSVPSKLCCVVNSHIGSNSLRAARGGHSLWLSLRARGHCRSGVIMTPVTPLRFFPKILTVVSTLPEVDRVSKLCLAGIGDDGVLTTIVSSPE
jgi:hypothetical protein